MKPHFVENWELGVPQTLAVFGTSLSFYLAPMLARELENRFGAVAQVANFGLSATASITALSRLDAVIEAAPHGVLMEFAVNDAHSFYHDETAFDAGISLQESRENLETLVLRLQKSLPCCEIWLQTTNGAWDSPRGVESLGTANCATHRPQLNAYFETVRAVARARGLQIVDNWNVWHALQHADFAHFAQLVPDGIHPSPRGIRELWIPQILRAWNIEQSGQT